MRPSHIAALKLRAEGLAALEQFEIRRSPATAFSGRLRDAVGSLLVAEVPNGAIGHLCVLDDPVRGRVGEAEIVGFRGSNMLLAPFGSPAGLSPRIEVASTGRSARLRASGRQLGCLLDWRGEVITRYAPPQRNIADTWRNLTGRPPQYLERVGVRRPIATGVRAIDGLLTLGEGQRLGLFGSAGLGKSTCVEMVVAGADVDVVIVGLIGERGREVTEFVDRVSRSPAAGRTTVIAATSDRPAVERLNAAMAATSLAEFYRDAGLRVLLVIDSLTRVARAARDLGLARGEPPTRRGFPPSVFDLLPPLLERAGATKVGSITAIYCVLVEGEIQDDPVAEEVKSLLDGHILLSADLAAKGVFPSIDLLESRSRSMRRIVDEAHLSAADRFRELAATYEKIAFLLRVGEYRAGQDPVADRSIALHEEMLNFLRQAPGETTAMGETLALLSRLST